MAQNIIGINPEFNGAVTVNGSLDVSGDLSASSHSEFSGSCKIALQPSVQTADSSVYAGTTDILANDIFGGILFFKAGAGDIFTLCSASDLESVISSAFGETIEINRTFWVTFINIDTSNSCTIASSPDFVIVNGDFTLGSKEMMNIRFKKYQEDPPIYVLVH